MRNHLPDLTAALDAHGVPVREASTQWLLCAFVDVMPPAAVARVWGLLWLDGPRALLAAAVAAFSLAEGALLAEQVCTIYSRTYVERERERQRERESE